MYKRRDYFIEDRDKPWSIKDEPVNFTSDETARTYPDMYKAYINFARTYRLSRNSFILTNSCENALRIVLEALRPKYMYIENPSWGLVETLANGLLYPRPVQSEEQRIFKVNFEFQNNRFILGSHLIKVPQEESAFYVTARYNNMFEHFPIDNCNEYAKYTILDETYSAEILKNPQRDIAENKFVIGSYSKLCGAGIRLGYVLFHPKWNNLMQMLREECISQLAAAYVNVRMPDIVLPKYEGSYVCRSNNYVTVKADEYNGDRRRINREFTVSGIRFYKLGLALKKIK